MVPKRRPKQQRHDADDPLYGGGSVMRSLGLAMLNDTALSRARMEAVLDHPALQLVHPVPFGASLYCPASRT